jgi:hypothetical protein
MSLFKGSINDVVHGMEGGGLCPPVKTGRAIFFNRRQLYEVVHKVNE